MVSVFILVAPLLFAVAHATPATQQLESQAAEPAGPTIQCFTTPCPQPERNYTIRADFKACTGRAAKPHIELYNETTKDWNRQSAPFKVQYLETGVAQFSVPSLTRGRILLTDGDYPTSRPVDLNLFPRAYLGGEATQAAGYGADFEPRRHTAKIEYLARAAGLGLPTPHPVSRVKFADTPSGRELKAGNRQVLWSSSADDALVFVTWCG